MTEAMPFLQKAILLSYAPRSFVRGFHRKMPYYFFRRNSGRGLPSLRHW